MDSTASLPVSEVTAKLTGERNPRGIPKANFIDNVEDFLGSLGALGTVDVIIAAIEELYRKYQFMESHMLKNKAQLKTKLPDIEKTLAMVQLLHEKKENEEKLQTRFSLADNVFANAEIDPAQDSVCLWLGANVMLEYTCAEAVEMLNKNLTSATAKLKDIEADLYFLRDQIITTEVNMARVYNYDVRKRREAR